ncbi:hypothetical protein [Algoriphagus sp. AK58]|uniref:hypothetical protein n=1 Tax=Algoriphagus sp. AK58 TaxID=1406877 RepID=UPI00164FA952|nr:hypothetical protein [Algoriphagus sp. AK58]MBC6368625.1 hypothetical protein [Algoriphagus sp. AK58]
MKKLILLLSGIVLGCFSCNTTKDQPKESYSLQVEDSVMIDHLGSLYLIDYDYQSDKYLLSDESFYSYVEVDAEGNKTYEGKLPVDGPDAIEMALGMGYFRGNVTVATANQGFKMFDKGALVGQISIPYQYNSFNFLPQLGLSEWNGGILYPRFLADSIMQAGFTEEFYAKTYSDPIFEFQKEGEGLRNLGELPKDSPFLNGNYHGSLVTVYHLDSENLYLLSWVRPDILKFEAKNGDLKFVESVSLDLGNWVSYDETPMSNAQNFYETYRKKMPGTVRNIHPVGDYFLLQYQSGIPEDVFSTILDAEGRPNPEQLAKLNPPLIAVLDKNLKVLSNGLRLPPASNGEFVVTKDGAIVVSKNPNLSETEDSGIILYKLKLTIE